MIVPLRLDAELLRFAFDFLFARRKSFVLGFYRVSVRLEVVRRKLIDR